MKRVLSIILALLIVFTLSGCGEETANECDYQFTIDAVVMEDIGDNLYMITKHEKYTLGGHYQLYTEKDLVIGEELVIVVYKDDTIKLFNEIVCVFEEGEIE